MAATINTNINSLNAQRNLAASANSLATSMQRLSSGALVNHTRVIAPGPVASSRTWRPCASVPRSFPLSLLVPSRAWLEAWATCVRATLWALGCCAFSAPLAASLQLTTACSKSPRWNDCHPLAREGSEGAALLARTAPAVRV